MSPETAVAYVRVSTEEQSREGVSLDAQEERIRAYAAMRGLALQTIFREEGVSAKIELNARPEGGKLVAAVGKRKAHHVIVLKLDRLFRNASDALNQTAEWDKAGCSLHVIDMGGSAIDTHSAMGRMFFTMAAAFAEMERNLVSERTRTALKHLKASGSAYCGVTPLGFQRDGDRFVPAAEELAIIERIQSMRRNGVSLRAIAEIFNKEGVPTKRGGKWHLVTLQSILRIHDMPSVIN